ncbi:hypothetical protein BGLT_00019 [Caballeronia glathei]|uniref:DUF3455 domain-containing protein n=2 Tax=Caballeronia glathei TaxID=60547 RepID=UPI0005017927|nr:DUF3455 domain-containing protein [Caballeronia glathei]CDY78835.1 hypothetical protein BGLT_00019 [Caballeronia glathei]
MGFADTPTIEFKADVSGRQPLRVVLHLLKVKTMFRNLLQSGFATVVVSILGACAAAPAGPASSSIDPPQADRVMTLVASGVQTYSCEFDAQRHLGWVFRSPQATLFDSRGHAAVWHVAGPSWGAEDGSRIVGRVLTQRPSETLASIPQLLLETRSTSGIGTLSVVRYVQRVHTVGGLMPTAPCSTEHELGSSPYVADYVFYR